MALYPPSPVGTDCLLIHRTAAPGAPAPRLSGVTERGDTTGAGCARARPVCGRRPIRASLAPQHRYCGGHRATEGSAIGQLPPLWYTVQVRERTHHVVIVPGLSDNPIGVAWLTRDWRAHYGLTPHVVRFGWRGQPDDFAPRLVRLGRYIDGLVATGAQVSLLGTSAGASAVLNAFFARRDDIRSVVSVCGRLRAGDGVYPSLDQSRNRLLFKPSVLRCDEGISRLTPADKAKILTIRPLFDELVPVTTMTIAGATNRRILAVEHMVGIYLALSVYARLIVDFLARV